jgi:hypothetical protein
MKKFITSVLMFALIGTSMYSLVSCKDRDNGYEDLKSMINKEISMREALEKQVEALKAALDNVEKCKCNLEEALKNYLTKDEASKNYETIAAHNASIEMLQGLINQINLTLGNIDTSKGDVATQLNNLNVLIEQVRAIANEAMRIAKEAKCECDLTPLENSIKNLEGQIAGWTEKIEEAQRNAAEALATVKGLEAQVNQNTRDINALKDDLANKYQELKNLINNISITGCTCDLSALRQELADAKQQLTTAYTLAINQAKQDIKQEYEAYVAIQLANYYTKGEIENMIPDVSNFLTRAQIEAMIPDISDFLTRAQIEALIPDVSNFLTAQQIETLFGNYYTKDQIDALIAQAGGGGLTVQQVQEMINNSLTNYVTETQVSQILNNYFKKDEITNMFSNYFTQEQINNMFNQYCTQEYINTKLEEYYTKTEILTMLGNYFNKTEITNMMQNYYPKDKIDEILNNYFTKEEILNKLGEYFTKTEINTMISNYFTKTEITNMITNYYTKTEVDDLLNKYFTKEQITAELAKYYTKDEITTILGQYYTQEKINEMFASYYTKTQIDSKLTEINNKFSDYVTVANFESTLANYYTKSEMDEKLRIINNAIDEVKDKLNKLDEKVTKLQNDVLKHEITQVIIQGATNNIFGAVNIPTTGGNTSLLATFWGELTKDVDFPYADANDYYYPKQLNAFLRTAVKYFDKNVTVSSGRFVDSKNGSTTGNLGTVYMTINPAETDFGGTQPLQGFFTSGTNTQAPVTISPLRHSDTDMTFGWTRSATNGFYEADVTLNAANIDNARLNIDLKGMASDVKTMLKERTKASVIELAAAVYKNAQNILPAYGANVAWKDESTGEMHNLYSQYNLGIMAVKPLGYNAIDGLSDKIAPNGYIRGYYRLQNFAGRLFREAKKKLHDLYPDINPDDFKIEFKSITIGEGFNPETGRYYDIQSDADGNIKVRVTGTVHITGNSSATGYSGAAQINGTTQTLEFTIPSIDIEGDGDFAAQGDVTQWLREMVDAINERYGAGSPIDNALANLTNLLNDLVQLEDDLDDMITSYQTRVSNFITRVNNKIVNYIDKAELALQLAMIGSSNNKKALLSSTIHNPTLTTSSSMTLYPTSYSAETLAPAYKKFVAVTNVYDAATHAQARDYESLAISANGNNMAQVYEGRRSCTINGQKGYIYEISYAALDFHGKICVKKYYVQFK